MTWKADIWDEDGDLVGEIEGVHPALLEAATELLECLRKTVSIGDKLVGHAHTWSIQDDWAKISADARAILARVDAALQEKIP